MCIDQLFILYIHKAAAMSNYKKMLVDYLIEYLKEGEY